MSRGLLSFLGLVAAVIVVDAGCGKGSDFDPISTTSSTGTGTTGGFGGTGGMGGDGGMAGDGGMGGDDTTSSGGTGGTGGTGGMGGMGGQGGGLPDHCFNGMQDGDETAQDCGGSCGGCEGDPCLAGTDCASTICDLTDNQCTGSNCADMVKNGAETGVDCGPGCTDTCMDGEGCNVNDHCDSGVCDNDICQAPTCMDLVENGDESGIDCGGLICPKCELGQTCNGPTDCVGGTCTGGFCSCPDKMVIATTPNMGSYCIDKTEVTYAEYAQFFTVNPSLANLPAECSWNINWTPGVGWPGVGKQTHAVIGVNWCQAYGYCQWQGKRLCGKFGGGPNNYADYADHTQSQWMNACTANGTNTYPYGQNYQPSWCNGADLGAGDTQAIQNGQGNPVNSPPGVPCQGGASIELWHMSGSVREWEDSCDGVNGQTDNCRLRGGSFQDGASGLMCGAADNATRSSSLADVGFRCCIGG